MSFQIEAADAELDRLSYSEIQQETAYKWGSRALASYVRALNSDSPIAAFFWIEMGNEFAHEALEHAALVEDGGELANEVGATMSEYKQSAVYALMGDDSEEGDIDEHERLESSAAESDSVDVSSSDGPNEDGPSE